MPAGKVGVDQNTYPKYEVERQRFAGSVRKCENKQNWRFSTGSTSHQSFSRLPLVRPIRTP